MNAPVQPSFHRPPVLRARDGRGAGAGSARKSGAPRSGLSLWQEVLQVPPGGLGKSLEAGGGGVAEGLEGSRPGDSLG